MGGHSLPRHDGGESRQVMDVPRGRARLLAGKCEVWRPVPYRYRLCLAGYREMPAVCLAEEKVPSRTCRKRRPRRDHQGISPAQVSPGSARGYRARKGFHLLRKSIPHSLSPWPSARQIRPLGLSITAYRLGCLCPPPVHATDKNSAACRTAP